MSIKFCLHSLLVRVAVVYLSWVSPFFGVTDPPYWNISWVSLPDTLFLYCGFFRGLGDWLRSCHIVVLHFGLGDRFRYRHTMMSIIYLLRWDGMEDSKDFIDTLNMIIWSKSYKHTQKWIIQFYVIKSH